MTSMSSSTECTNPVTMLQYRDISKWAGRESELTAFGLEGESESARARKTVELTEAELASRIACERADAAIETEQRLHKEYEQRILAVRAPVAAAVAGFEKQSDEYYAKVEAEIVQLALAIAARILHREAQVDPMLVAALVRLAMENMREGSTVTIRVSPGRAEAWRQYFAEVATASRVEVVDDPQLTCEDCVLETELGSADFSLDKQLKEVQQGFFDLLALRPVSK